jgi:hypothetical protein
VRSEVVNSCRSEISPLPEVGTSSGQEEVSRSCGHRLLTLEVGTGRGHTGGGQEEWSRWDTRVEVGTRDGDTLGGDTIGDHQWQCPDVGWGTPERAQDVNKSVKQQ